MRLLTIKTAATEAGISRRTLQRWLCEGRVQKLQGGKVDLDEVSKQKDYLLAARRRGPAPGVTKSQPLDPASDEGFNKWMLAEKRHLDTAIRAIDRIDDPVLVAFIIDHATAKLPRPMREDLKT